MGEGVEVDDVSKQVVAVDDFSCEEEVVADEEAAEAEEGHFEGGLGLFVDE